MSDINRLVQLSNQPLIIENNEYIVEMVAEPERIILELAKPELDEGEWAVARIDKHNPKTNRMKTFEATKWLKTKIKPEDRTLKNLPRDSKKKAKVKFQDWLLLKGWGSRYSTGISPSEKCYGWSHRAVGEFYVGKKIKSANTIGNKITYGPKIDKKYNEMSDKYGYEVADKWIKNLPFKPYTIKTVDEAKEHAERFAADVS